MIFDWKVFWLKLVLRPASRSGEECGKMRLESWPNGVRPTHEPSTALRVPPVCKQISRRVSAEILFLPGSVSGDGFRAVLLSREFGIRDVPPIVRQPTLPRWLPRQSRSLHLVRRQRKSRRENLRGLRAGSDWHRATALRSRSHRRAARPESVCVGFHHHRLVSFPVLVGPFPEAPSRCPGILC